MSQMFNPVITGRAIAYGLGWQRRKVPFTATDPCRFKRLLDTGDILFIRPNKAGLMLQFVGQAIEGITGVDGRPALWPHVAVQVDKEGLVEAVDSGVCYDYVNKYLDKDKFQIAALRLPLADVSRLAIAKKLLSIASHQPDKIKYDWGGLFSPLVQGLTQDPHKFYCSELAATVYSGLLDIILPFLYVFTPTDLWRVCRLHDAKIVATYGIKVTEC